MPRPNTERSPPRPPPPARTTGFGDQGGAPSLARQWAYAPTREPLHSLGFPAWHIAARPISLDPRLRAWWQHSRRHQGSRPARSQNRYSRSRLAHGVDTSQIGRHHAVPISSLVSTTPATDPTRPALLNA